MEPKASFIYLIIQNLRVNHSYHFWFSMVCLEKFANKKFKIFCFILFQSILILENCM